MDLAKLTKQFRKAAGLTQAQLAEKAGVGLRFVRELEQGKETLRLDKINQVLGLFGLTLTAEKNDDTEPEEEK
ncbi:MAG: helix-turn-helix transcriptional regulator [Bacteroidia bacterium]|jgi:y4mF family transcriptional regulator|nr:helix-turn-helix transcriptional regulator [Bacteroidia bacterium]